MNFKKESIHLVFNDRIKPNLHALYVYIRNYNYVNFQ